MKLDTGLVFSTRSKVDAPVPATLYLTPPGPRLPTPQVAQLDVTPAPVEKLTLFVSLSSIILEYLTHTVYSMGYSDDVCMDEFTAGQTTCFKSQLATYRMLTI